MMILHNTISITVSTIDTLSEQGNTRPEPCYLLNFIRCPQLEDIQSENGIQIDKMKWTLSFSCGILHPLNKSDKHYKGGENMALTNDDLQAIATLLQPINNRLDKMDNRLDKMDCRLDKIESEVSALKIGQTKLEQQIKEVNRKVSETYELALEAWGTGTENRTWLENANLKI